MTIEIWTEADAFLNKCFPEAMGSVDLEKSYRNFERMLEAELTRFYPAAEITVHVADSRGTIIHLDQQDITASTQGHAMSVYANVRVAMDKLFFYGQFWEDKRPGERIAETS